jgi:LysR family transcriptional regulator, putative pyruvate carboxylase regulator
MTRMRTRTTAVAGKGDRLRTLRAFCQTVRLGSVSRAALALHLSQPAVSLQLQALERDLGTQLFERGGRRLVPTAEGEALYELARPLVEAIDELPARLRERVSPAGAGELRIVATSATALELLAGAVAAFRGEHPGVRLALLTAPGVGGPDLVQAREADIAFGSIPAVPPGLAYTAVFASTPMLLLPRGHPLATTEPLSLAALSAYGFILPPAEAAITGTVAERFERARLPWTQAMEIDDPHLTKQAVAMGLGVSIVDAVDVSPEDRHRLVARPVGNGFPDREFGHAVRRGEALAPAARAFVALIAANTLPEREGCSLLAGAS